MRNNASHYTRHGPGADADLARRARKRFTSVDLSVSDVTFAGLGRVDATKLVGLNLSFCHEIDDHALAVVGQFALLEQLDLSACRSITGAAMADLRGLRRLTQLNLDYCADLADGALPPLAELPSLRTLSLFSCDTLTAEGLRALAASPNLRELTLPGFGSADAALFEALARLPVEFLAMTCEPLSDDTIRALRGFRSLRDLVVGPPPGAGAFGAPTLDALRRALPHVHVRVVV